MQSVLVLLFVQIALSFCALLPTQEQSSDGILFNWNKYKEFHGKQYDGQEDQDRRKIYIKNSQIVLQHNKEFQQGLQSFKLEMNHFGDIAPHEFRKMMNGFKRKFNETKASIGAFFMTPSFVQIPDQLDWRQKGYVTSVKNQGQCGSCWAFSSTGALEGQHFRKSGKLISLSEQQLVDCSGKFGNEGCNGGLMDQAFDYIKDNSGLDTENSYPYDGIDKKCRFKKDAIGATDVGHVDVLPAGDEDKLKEALATVGPISVAIDASHETFQLYSKGVYDEKSCSSQDLDHGVLAVGYGTEDGKDYWLVKNSWGEEWGEQGYIKMSRNKENQCGIASSASYPLV
jgi:cathepsin L